MGCGISAETARNDFADYLNESPSRKATLCWGTVVVVLITIITLVSSSLEKVASTELGITYNTITCSLNDEIMTEGLRTKPPFGEIIIWPAIYQTVQYQGTTQVECISEDGVIILLDASFQFVPVKEKLYELTKKYENFETYERLVYYQGRSSLRHSCGKFTALEFQTKRADLQEVMETGLMSDTEYLNLRLVDLQLRNVQRPAKYEVAVEAKETARADNDLAMSERTQELTKAATIMSEVLLIANQTLDSAETDAMVEKNYAIAKSQAALLKYEQYARVFGNAKRTHGFSTKGILSYIGNSIMSTGENTKLLVQSPSKLSYKDDL